MELGNAHWINVAQGYLCRALIGTYGKLAQRAAVAYVEKHPRGYRIEGETVYGFYVPVGDRRMKANHWYEIVLFSAEVRR